MSSKRIVAPSAFSFPTLARASVRAPPCPYFSPLQTCCVAIRAKSSIATSSHHVPLAHHCSSASWMRKEARTGASLTRWRGLTSRSFTISASLRREAAEEASQTKPEDIEFKQYQFEDVCALFFFFSLLSHTYLPPSLQCGLLQPLTSHNPLQNRSPQPSPLHPPPPLPAQPPYSSTSANPPSYPGQAKSLPPSPSRSPANPTLSS